MCWLRKAFFPLVRQMVFFSSPPTASTEGWLSFKKTGTGKIKRHKANLRHILTSKAKKRKKKLGDAVLVSDADYKKVMRMIPY